MSLREAWSKVGRADRCVWTGAIVLIALSFLPQVAAIQRFFAPTPSALGGLAQPAPLHGFLANEHLDWLRWLAQDVLIATAVALVLAWELARWMDRAIRNASLAVLGFMVSLPVALPLAFLAGGLAERASHHVGDHPLFKQVVPAAVSVGAIVYLLVTALIVLAVKDRRRESDNGQAAPDA